MTFYLFYDGQRYDFGRAASARYRWGKAHRPASVRVQIITEWV